MKGEFSSTACCPPFLTEPTREELTKTKLLTPHSWQQSRTLVTPTVGGWVGRVLQYVIKIYGICIEAWVSGKMRSTYGTCRSQNICETVSPAGMLLIR